jgi:hypothetical protein
MLMRTRNPEEAFESYPEEVKSVAHYLFSLYSNHADAFQYVPEAYADWVTDNYEKEGMLQHVLIFGNTYDVYDVLDTYPVQVWDALIILTLNLEAEQDEEIY